MMLSKISNDLLTKEGPLTVILQTTSACNLNCIYCYCDHGKSKPLVIKDFENIVIKLDESFNSNMDICLLFHGGEPLLLGIEFYQQAFSFLRKFERHFYTGIQTNLTLLDEPFAELFLENKCSISTSMDGILSVHDINRKFSNGLGSFHCVREKMDLLNKMNIGFGIVTVLNNENIKSPRDFHTFINDNLNRRINFSPMFLPNQNGSNSVNIKKLGCFLILLYDIWVEDSSHSKLSFFEDIIANFLGGNLSPLCTFQESCGQDFITISSDGDVYLCSHFVGQKKYCYGNILISTFSEIWDSKTRIKMLEREKDSRARCRGCDFFEICFSGCMANTIESIYEKDYFCEAYKMLFRHIKKSLNYQLNLLTK